MVCLNLLVTSYDDGGYFQFVSESDTVTVAVTPILHPSQEYKHKTH